jgi:hypothetical protein
LERDGPVVEVTEQNSAPESEEPDESYIPLGEKMGLPGFRPLLDVVLGCLMLATTACRHVEGRDKSGSRAFEVVDGMECSDSAPCPPDWVCEAKIECGQTVQGKRCRSSETLRECSKPCRSDSYCEGEGVQCYKRVGFGSVCAKVVRW